MRTFFLFSAFTLLFVLFSCSSQKTGDSQKYSLKGCYEKTISYKSFLDPPSEYRSFPFYSLNDKLEPAELRRQIKGFKEAGFGGFYLHSRVGLLTNYLSNDWWTAIDTAVAAAKEYGLNAWFYDEDKWPSGFGGGIIPRKGEEYRAKGLVRLAKDVDLPPGCDILKSDQDYNYICYTAQMGNPDFNGTSWVDLMNPKVVKEFIELTHKSYIERYKDGYSRPFAIFSDEPHICARYFEPNTPNEGILSYSPTVRDRFLKSKGYDFLDKVDELFEEKGDWRKVRLDYFQSVAKQFAASFSKQMGEYCAANRTRFTGHYLSEDVLRKVRNRIGNSMLQYRNMHIPGMDHLGLSIANRLLTARSVSSVANQYGMPRRMSELFGISGQNMNFDDRRWIANWHAINGINHFCPHLSLHSMKGVRKRDYPPTFSYHQPYWKYNKTVEDYLGRISYAATVGKYDPDILVINPLESEYLRGNSEPEFTSGLQVLLKKLQELHYDYDLGDEQILADTALVGEGKITVGQMQYRAVLLPDMIELRKSTINLLLQFAQRGGEIFHYGDRFPQFADGLKSDTLLSRLSKNCQMLTDADFDSFLGSRLPGKIEILGEEGNQIWTQVRKSEDGYLIMLTNISHLSENHFRLRSKLIGKNPVLWDPVKGECFSLKSDKEGFYSIELPHSSLVWITSGRFSDDVHNAKLYKSDKKYQTVRVLDEEWKGRRLSSNAITLDFAQYSTDNGMTWSKPEPVIGIQERLTKQQYEGPLKLRYLVNVSDIPACCNLVVEQPGIYEEVVVNDKKVSFGDNDYFVDRQFLSTDITNSIVAGNNRMDLSVSYSAPDPLAADQVKRYGTEIESIYLTGDFAVRGKGMNIYNDSQRNNTGYMPRRPVYGFDAFSVSKEDSVFNRNLTAEGYPFYEGAFELTQVFKMDQKEKSARYMLKIPDVEAVVVEIELNGENYAPVTYFPVQIDISSALRSGKNTLNIKLTNSLRNLLGPHHHSWKEMTRVGPSTFSGKGGFPNGKGNADWYDLRLTGEKTTAWNNEYYCIPFGLLSNVEILESRN
jgi:hypothetical protein